MRGRTEPSSAYRRSWSLGKKTKQRRAVQRKNTGQKRTLNCLRGSSLQKMLTPILGDGALEDWTTVMEEGKSRGRMELVNDQAGLVWVTLMCAPEKLAAGDLPVNWANDGTHILSRSWQRSLARTNHTLHHIFKITDVHRSLGMWHVNLADPFVFSYHIDICGTVISHLFSTS
ncbi:hypothetical protein BJX63DRAFT_170758 [Aspergillus granulosus]|uniref:Uncharacterized protein n=1 Tax=Aspergillus granulosus TaxID=176169 RepID=A0ABR4HK88_9EURO